MRELSYDGCYTKEVEIIQLTKEFTFCASHRLHNENQSDGWNRKIYGKCNNYPSHGHTWKLGVTVEGKVNPDTGMIINFSDLKEIVNGQIIDELDHKHLNDIIGIPTCENLCHWIWARLESPLAYENVGLYELKLFESETSCCVYRGEDEL